MDLSVFSPRIKVGERAPGLKGINYNTRRAKGTDQAARRKRCRDHQEARNAWCNDSKSISGNHPALRNYKS